MKQAILPFYTAAVIFGQTRAFWGKGHLLVSRIAQRVLQNENPSALDLALAELSTLA